MIGSQLLMNGLAGDLISTGTSREYRFAVFLCISLALMYPQQTGGLFNYRDNSFYAAKFPVDENKRELVMAEWIMRGGNKCLLSRKRLLRGNLLRNVLF